MTLAGRTREQTQMSAAEPRTRCSVRERSTCEEL